MVRSGLSPSTVFLVTVVVLLLAVPFHLRPENFIVDDGYFYPQIARNIVHGHGSTFNGIMPTNGYHPLWMVCCVVVAALTSRATSLVQILGGLQDLLLLASVLLIMAAARVARLRGAFLGCLAILFFNMVLGIWRLLESPLSLFMQVVVLVLAVPCLPAVYARLGRWRTPLLGLALGLALLSRLDLMFFVLVVLGHELLFAKNDGSFGNLRSTVVAGTLAAVIVTPYLVWNWESFHHLAPVSGAIKSTFPHLQRWTFPNFLKPVLLAILLNLTRAFRKQRTPFDTLCVLTAVAAGVHIAYTLSFGELAPWYLTTGYLSFALCVAWVTEGLLTWAPRLRWLEPAFAGVLCLAFLGVGTLRAFSNLTFTHLVHGAVSLHGNYREAKRAFAGELNRNLAPGSRMFVFDAPGGIALYSGMSVLPVDGLVADYRYNQDLVSQGATAYAADHNIRYFVAPRLREGQVYDRLFLKGHGTGTGSVYELEAPLTRKPAGTLNLADSQLILSFRQVNPELEQQFPELGVWRIEATPAISPGPQQ